LMEACERDRKNISIARNGGGAYFPGLKNYENHIRIRMHECVPKMRLRKLK